MTLMLANYEPELITEYSPSWIEVAKKLLFDHLCNVGVPVGNVRMDDNLLFIGETSPDIAIASHEKKKFSILLFMSNPFHILSEMALLNVDTLYTINAEHAYIVRTWLAERFGGQRRFKVMHWAHYPKVFEPPMRTKKLIGIVEPDFNSSNVFDHFFAALTGVIGSTLYATDYDFAFYCFHQETYDRLHERNSKVPLHFMHDPSKSPFIDLSTMPDAMLSLDSFGYNPVLSSLSKRIPVVRPEWANPERLPKTSTDFRNVTGVEIAYRLLNDFVNNIRRIEELEKSKRVQDDLMRREMLGDMYGDYSKVRRTE